MPAHTLRPSRFGAQSPGHDRGHGERVTLGRSRIPPTPATSCRSTRSVAVFSVPRRWRTNWPFCAATARTSADHLRLSCGRTPPAGRFSPGTKLPLQAKLAHYFPEGIEQRYQGAWRDYVFHATPDRAIAHFRALIDAGIQYFIVETMDAMDHETIRLLATDVIPSIGMAGRQRR